MTLQTWLLNRARLAGEQTPGASTSQSDEPWYQRPFSMLESAGQSLPRAVGAAGMGLARTVGAGMIPESAEPPAPPPTNAAPGAGMTRAHATGHATPILAPSDVTRDTEEPSPLFSPAEEAQQHAASYHAPTRAIRMPDGRLVFTNRQDADVDMPEGRDVGYSKGVGEAREANRAAVSRLDPTSATMSGLLKASIRANRGKGPGEATGGAVSRIEGTPQQQLAYNLEDAQGAAALAGARSDEKVASMDPVAQVMLGNKDIQAGSWALSQVRPELERIEADRGAKMQLISAIPDAATQQRERFNLETEHERRLREAMMKLSLLMGLRPSTGP